MFAEYVCIFIPYKLLMPFPVTLHIYVNMHGNIIDFNGNKFNSTKYKDEKLFHRFFYKKSYLYK